MAHYNYYAIIKQLLDECKNNDEIVTYNFKDNVKKYDGTINDNVMILDFGFTTKKIYEWKQPEILSNYKEILMEVTNENLSRRQIR